MGLAQLILPGAIAWWCRKRATDNYTVARYDNNTWYQENIQGIRTKGSRFVITNVLNVRSTPPVKERGSKYTTDNKCVMFLLYVATAVLLLLYIFLLKVKPIETTRSIPLVAGSLRRRTNNMWGFLGHILGPAGRKTIALIWRASSWTPNTPSNATVLGRDPDTRRKIVTTPSLAPQPIVRQRTFGRRSAACLNQNQMIIKIYIYDAGWLYARQSHVYVDQTVPTVKIQ